MGANCRYCTRYHFVRWPLYLGLISSVHKNVFAQHTDLKRVHGASKGLKKHPLGRASANLWCDFWACLDPSSPQKTNHRHHFWASLLIHHVVSPTTGSFAHTHPAMTKKTGQKTAIVVGAGVGGVATAARLAKAGFKVTVFEKNDFTGGRCSLIHHDGYVR